MLSKMLQFRKKHIWSPLGINEGLEVLASIFIERKVEHILVFILLWDTFSGNYILLIVADHKYLTAYIWMKYVASLLITIAAENILIFFSFFLYSQRKNKTWHFMWIVCNSHEMQTIHMKCQVFFSLKNTKNQNVFCWSCDWQFKTYSPLHLNPCHAE